MIFFENNRKAHIPNDTIGKSDVMKKTFSLASIVVAWALLFTACTGNPGIKFPIEQSLTAIEIKATSDVYIRYPFRVRQVDSFLYVMDLHATDYYCHQFAYPSMKHICSYGKRGEAPNEFLDAENIRFDAKGKLWLLDANKSKLASWSAGDSLCSEEIPLEKNLMRVLDFVPYNDSIFLVPDYSGTHRFCRIDKEGKIKSGHFTIPTAKDHSLVPPVLLSQAWRAFVDYNPRNGILAMATQLGHVLEIYNVNRDEMVAVKTGKHDEPDFKVKGIHAVPCGIMGYSDIYVGENEIYALFWGHSFDDMKRSKTPIQGGNQIEVFDLKGEPLKKYVLDRKIAGFDIDEANKRLIALELDSDRPIAVYELD